MINQSQVKVGGFYLEDGLPDEYYAFTDGEISMTVERGGGINTIQMLDTLRHEGKLYPDRCPTPPIILKEGGTCGKRELYGPGIQFISTNRFSDGRAGRNLFHVPDRLELYPFGFISESERFGHRAGYDLCIDGRTILFRFTNAFPTRDRLVMTLNKDHLTSGEMVSMKNQVKEWMLLYGLDASAKDSGHSFPDSYRMTLSWDFIGLDETFGAFVMDGRMKFAYGEKKVVVMIASDHPLEIQKHRARHILTYRWNPSIGGDEIRLCMAVGESRDEAAKLAADRNRRFDEICAAKIAENTAYALKAPSVHIENAPYATEFARTVPAFEKSLLLADNGREICIRAATHKYGFYAAWDQIYPVKAFLLMGDYETARRLLRYMLTFSPMEPIILQLTQMIAAVEEVVAYSGDRKFLEESYGILKHWFEYLSAKIDPTTGFLAHVNGLGVDDPVEVGIKHGEQVWFPCVNGWWYDECRAMENLGLLMNDPATVATARSLSEKLDAHYMEVFFDGKKGYLHSVVNPKDGRTTGVYQNVSTIAIDYPYGEYLFRMHTRDLAEYQAYALYHPAGRSGVAYDDNAHEMWKSVTMFQNLAHEAKIARAAGMGDEALRTTNTYLKVFNRCKVGIETHNLTGCHGDISQRANWQAFGARACYSAIVEALLGIQWDLGGFHYVPCEVEGGMSIRQFPFRSMRWNIEISGEGAYVEDFIVDDLPLLGTLRLPSRLLEGEGDHRLQIVRSRRPFMRPTLLSAVGASVANLKSSECDLSFGVEEPVHTAVKVFCPIQPAASLDGRAVPVEWNTDNCIAWCDLVMTPGQKLRVSIYDHVQGGESRG